MQHAEVYPVRSEVGFLDGVQAGFYKGGRTERGSAAFFLALYLNRKTVLAAETLRRGEGGKSVAAPDGSHCFA